MELRNFDSKVLCRELSVEEMQNVEGGIIHLIGVIAAGVVLSFLFPSQAY